MYDGNATPDAFPNNHPTRQFESVVFLQGNTDFGRVIVRVIVASFKKKEAFSFYRATITRTITRVKTIGFAQGALSFGFPNRVVVGERAYLQKQNVF